MNSEMAYCRHCLSSVRLRQSTAKNGEVGFSCQAIKWSLFMLGTVLAFRSSFHANSWWSPEQNLSVVFYCGKQGWSLCTGLTLPSLVEVSWFPSLARRNGNLCTHLLDVLSRMRDMTSMQRYVHSCDIGQALKFKLVMAGFKQVKRF